MKKNIVRIMALALMLILALGLLPLGAMAASAGVAAVGGTKRDQDWEDKIKDDWFVGVEKSKGKTVTIKTSDYKSYISRKSGKYDLKGIVNLKKAPAPNASSSKWNKEIPVLSSYKAKDGELVWLLYVPHQHSLSYWYYDTTTHWRECLVCRENFMYQNWHYDGEEDRICDVCGASIPYHEVAVIETEGGTITVNEVEAPHRRKIIANAEAADGYEFKKLHFTKVRDDGSKQEITRYQNGQDFWTYMPTYDLEITAEFTKK